ncbi:hypothetical protein NLG97_g1033 [Lecanicillium saksenae]|uniref:Uncharacterized protein n=1 Tax=Lecanicillium saksenae TaxID=468837 RepID=A0ACC1R8A2_9HYPO|nr:hypothetical protein NLG97_g1033 [Lecanicillium saksenae]
MDDSFGPRLLGHFDFTLLFEHTMLHITPASIVVFATPFYLYTLFTSTAIVRAGILLWIKAAFALALIGIQIANAVLWSESPLESRLAEAAAIMTSISAGCMAIMAVVGHIFFLRAPSFLSLALTVTMIFDIGTTWTYFHRNGLESIARLHVPLPVIKLILIGLEEVSKRSLVRSEALRASLGQEALAGFWNRSLLLWVNPLLAFGFREELTMNILPGLGPHLEAEFLYQHFKPRWQKTNNVSKFALVKACVYTVPWPFLYIILPRLLSIGFNFAQPFLLQDVVSAVAADTEPPTDVMRGLILATTAIYVGKAISTSWYTHLRNQIMMSVRAILISAIYNKSLNLPADELSNAAAITLMSADVTGVGQLISLSYESWARVLEMGLGIGILAVFVGAAALFALIPTILTSVASTFVARRMMTTRKTWNGHMQNRIAATSNILAQVKDIKMLGLNSILTGRLQTQFEQEVEISMANRQQMAATFGIADIAQSMTPVLVVAGYIFWTRASEPISASRFFSTLAVVTLVSAPLSSFVQTLGSWSSGFACLNRIQKYLNLPEMEDTRRFAVQVGMGDADAPLPGAVSLASSNLRNRQKVSANVVQFAVQLSRVSVCTDLSGSILNDVSVNVSFGGTTMVCGPVGCGKSTLLRAILGEAPLRCGTVTLASLSIAYCAQVPWIQNTSILNNILGGRPYNAVLYRQVVHICALDVDIARLPNGDKTLCGSDGCNLSGGQKQRISLARTLFTQAELLVLDDVFSSLDRDTSSTIRIRLFSESDYLANNMTTIIMTTRPHLVDADTIYKMDNCGRIELKTLEQIDAQAARESATQPTSAGSTDTSQAGSSGAVTSPTTDAEPPQVKPIASSSIRDNLSSKQYADFSLYKYYLKSAGLQALLLWLLVIIIASISERMPQIYARFWLDRNPNNRLYFIGYACLGLLAPCLAASAALATFEFLTDQDAGTLLNRFSQDISMATQELPMALLPTVWGFVSLVVDVTIISSGASYATPIIPFFLLVLFFIQHFYLHTSRQLRILELDSTKTLTKHSTESATGIEHIRALQLEEDFTVEFYRMLNEAQKPIYVLYAIQQWLVSVMDFATATAAVSVVSLALNFKKSTSATAMGLALLGLISFSDFTSQTIRFFVNMENTFGAVSRIRDFAKHTPIELDEDCEDVPGQWPVSGKLDLRSVSAVYNVGVRAHTEKPHIALENVTMSIEPGQTVGLVGRTGSGKTSVLLALLHLLEYTGSIYIDGRELRTVPRELLRNRITTITQSGVQLRASVRFNMDPLEFGSRPGNYPNDDTLAGILRRVGLWDHILRHGGLDAEMRAMKFSVGQAQLFQLARAILHRQITRSKLVLIDEGTASLDAETETRMLNLMREAFAGCTKMVISHRDTVLTDADVEQRLGLPLSFPWELASSSTIVMSTIASGSDQSEQQPLLQHEHSADRGHVDQLASSRRRLIISSLLIMFSSNITAILVDTAGNQLVEGAACKQLHPEVTDWYHDPICKSLDVQDRLALVTGWEYSWSLVPGLLLAIPYGIFIDRYGPRAMAVLVALGGVITQVIYLTITQYPNIFDLRWIWGCAIIGSVVGGANIGWQALTLTVCNMISTKNNRAEVLFYMTSISTMNMLLGGFVVYWAMNIGPVFTQSLGCIGFAVETLFAFTLPRGLATGEPVKQTDSEASAWEAIRHGFSGIKDGVGGFGRLFSRNRQLGLLLFSLIISTIGLRQSGIRQQYVTHRYGWSWGKAGLMVSITSTTTLIVMVLLVPLASRRLLRTHSAMGKDIIIARAGILSLALGSVFVGLAKTSEQFIAALVFYETESCYMPAIISVIAAMAGVDSIQKERTGSLYIAVVFMKNLGAIVAGPIVSSLLRVGMRLGGDWVGLPFFVEGGIQLITIAIVFSISESRYRNLQKQQDGEDEDTAESN